MTEDRPAPPSGPAKDTPVPAATTPMAAEARRRIGRNLRLLYADVLAEPIPDRFEALLADLTARGETSP